MSLVWLLLSVGVVVCLALTYSDPLVVIRLVWDLDRRSMKILCSNMEWVLVNEIVSIHLLPGLCAFKVKIESGKTVSISVFPDSVSQSEYRRLKIALQLGKMELASTATRN
nr:hypothetical protein [Neptunomonas antarctica]